MNENYSYAEIKRVQQRLLVMAKEIRDVLERNQIPYFITYGTLLGAVRHKGFIPWDDDFDFYLFAESYDEAIAVLRQELGQDMFVEDAQSEPLFYHGWARVKDLTTEVTCGMYPVDGCYQHHGVCIDLFKVTKVKANTVGHFRLTEHLDYLRRRHQKQLLGDEEFLRRSAEVTAALGEAQQQLEQTGEGEKYTYATVLPVLDRMEIDELFPLKDYVFEDTRFLGPNNADAFLSKRYGDYMALPSEDQREPHYSQVTWLKRN